jgi:hypothetical protein
VTAYATVVPGRARRAGFALALIIALICSAIVPFASAHAAPLAASGKQSSSTQAAAPLKAVIVVGPTHSSTSRYLGFGESLAVLAESYGMDVRRIFHPRATAARLKEAIQGANLVAYFGHGNGWPSPYAPFQEKTKNGMGLNLVEGGSQNSVEYYGGNWFRNNVTLAENAVVMFGGLCYAEGNGEPGMGIPGWDVARQRVDNYAAAFLAIGAGAVYAYGWQSVNTVLEQLMTTDKTVDDIFMIRGRTTSPSSGFIDWDDRWFDSQRMPGFKNHLDPHPQEGYLRAVSGRMNMTAAEFRNGQPPTGGGDPEPTPTNQPPTVPQGVTATPQADGSVHVSWQPSTDDQTGAVRYRVFRNGTKVGTLSTALSYTDWPSPGTHSYKVRAVDVSGLTSAFSSTVWATVQSTAAPLTAPTNLVGSHIGGGKVQLSWDAATGGSGTLKYRVFRNGTAIGTKQTARTYTDTVTSSGSYTYTVRVIDGTGAKKASAPTVVAVSLGGGDEIGAPDTVAPLAPGWMGAKSLGYRRVELTWGAATDNRAGTLTYQLFRGNTRIATLTGRSYVDRPKTAGTKTYWVRAVDAAGNKGAWATVQGVAVKGPLN